MIKGYTTSIGYMGYVPSEGDYRLFDTDDEYKQYILENEEESN